MILNGTKIADVLNLSLKKDIDLFCRKFKNRKPKIAIVYIGSNYASDIYVKKKLQLFRFLGIESELIKHKEISTESFINLLDKLNSNSDIDGYLVQFPVEVAELSQKDIINLISPRKDVEMICASNLANIIYQYSPDSKCILPCTVKAILEILRHYKISTKRQNVVIVGASYIIGWPLSYILTKQEATVTICTEFTTDLKYYLENADIIISATGIKNLIDASMVKANAVLIDVGIRFDQNQKIHGDLDFDSFKSDSYKLTSVPGGIGPLTVHYLCSNLFDLYKQSLNRNF